MTDPAVNAGFQYHIYILNRGDETDEVKTRIPDYII
jgi:hypothetical protein